MHAGVHMGAPGSGGLQAARHRGGTNLSGQEENQGKLQGMWRVNDCLLPVTSYGDNTWDSIAAGEGRGRRGRRSGGIQGVNPSDPKVGGLPGRGMPGQG